MDAHVGDVWRGPELSLPLLHAPTTRRTQVLRSLRFWIRAEQASSEGPSIDTW